MDADQVGSIDNVMGRLDEQSDVLVLLRTILPPTGAVESGLRMTVHEYWSRKGVAQAERA